MLFSKLLDTKAILPLVAKMIGVDATALGNLASLAQKDLAPHAGPGFSLIPQILRIVKGDVTGLRELYNGMLANPKMRPVVASLVTDWLAKNDTEHVAMKAMSFVSELPVVGMDRDFNSVEEFLTHGLFPMMDEVLKTDHDCDTCHIEMHAVGDSLFLCPSCDQYKDA